MNCAVCISTPWQAVAVLDRVPRSALSVGWLTADIALKLHPEIDRTGAISLLYAVNDVGWLVGPLAGGYLMVLGVANVFYIAAGVTLLATVVVQFAIAPPTQLTQEDSLWAAMRRENSLRLLKVQAMRPLLIYHFLFTLGLNAFYEFYPLWLVERFSFQSIEIGWGTVAITLSMILSSVYAVTLAENRFGPMGTVRRASLALAVIRLLLPLSTDATLYPAYMANRFEAHDLGRVQGLLTTNFCVASVIAALLGSLIALAGTGWAQASGGVLMLCASLWLWKWQEPMPAEV